MRKEVFAHMTLEMEQDWRMLYAGCIDTNKVTPFEFKDFLDRMGVVNVIGKDPPMYDVFETQHIKALLSWGFEDWKDYLAQFPTEEIR